MLVSPPTWSFGADADAVLDEPLPQVGALYNILDASGRPRALVQTTAAGVVPFGRFDTEHARLEGEGEGNLAHWRDEHERLFRAGGHVATDMEVVVERFPLLYAA